MRIIMHRRINVCVSISVSLPSFLLLQKEPDKMEEEKQKDKESDKAERQSAKVKEGQQSSPAVLGP